MSLLRLLFLGLVAIGVSLSASSAMAQSPSNGGSQQARDQMAREHFQSGRAYFASGDYERALDAFESARELSGRPALYYNIYLCHERLGHWGEAADALESFLAEGDPGDERTVLESRLGHLRERAAEAEAAAQASVDEEGAPASADPSETAEPAEDGGAMRVGAISSFSVAGAGAVLWLVGGAMGLSENNDLESTCSPNCTDAEVSRLETLNTVANVGIVLTALGAATGITLLLLGKRGGDDARAEISPWVGRSTAGLTARGSF